MRTVIILNTLMVATVLAEMQCTTTRGGGGFHCREYRDSDDAANTCPTQESTWLQVAGATPADNNWGDFNDGVENGMGALTDTVEAIKDPTLANVGGAIASAGALVAMAPPPAGPLIGGAMAVVGGIISLFDDSPSPEDVMMENQQKMMENQRMMMENQRMILENQRRMINMLNSIKADTEQILRNQYVMQQSLNRIEFRMTLQWQFKQGDIDQISNVYKTLVEKQKQFQYLDTNAEPQKLWNDVKMVKDSIGSYAVYAANTVAHYSQYFKPNKVKEYLDFVQLTGYKVGTRGQDLYKLGNFFEGIELYHQLMAARFNLFAIQTAAALHKNNTFEVRQLTELLQSDLEGYKQLKQSSHSNQRNTMNAFQAGPMCLAHIDTQCKRLNAPYLGQDQYTYQCVQGFDGSGASIEAIDFRTCFKYTSPACKRWRQRCPNPISTGCNQRIPIVKNRACW